MEDSPAATREKKAALLGVIELQRKLIQQREEDEIAISAQGKSAQSSRTSGNSGNSGNSSNKNYIYNSL